VFFFLKSKLGEVMDMEEQKDIAKITGIRDWIEIRKVSEDNHLKTNIVMKAVAGTLKAETQNQFYTKDEDLLKGEIWIDYSTRLSAAKMKAEFLDRELQKQSELDLGIKLAGYIRGPDGNGRCNLRLN
jgi:hypothetical protein